MSFMDEMRQHQQAAKTQQNENRRRLIAISKQIIRNEIGANYRNFLLGDKGDRQENL